MLPHSPASNVPSMRGAAGARTTRYTGGGPVRIAAGGIGAGAGRNWCFTGQVARVSSAYRPIFSIGTRWNPVLYTGESSFSW